MLNNKVAIVTGASRGIGRAIALRLAKEGADIAVVYSADESGAASVKAEISALSRRCEAYRCDVSDFEAAGVLCNQVIHDLGGVDILINNAGIVRDALVLSMKEEDFSRVIDVNLKGAFHMIRHLYSHMMKKRAGRIVNISSVVGISGNAGQANYAAAKAGIFGLTKSVARELAARSITCNAIAPGFIETNMTAKLSEKTKEAIISSIPMHRTGLADDVAAAVAFFCGEDANYITGEVLRVDGGLAM